MFLKVPRVAIPDRPSIQSRQRHLCSGQDPLPQRVQPERAKKLFDGVGVVLRLSRDEQDRSTFGHRDVSVLTDDLDK